MQNTQKAEYPELTEWEQRIADYYDTHDCIADWEAAEKHGEILYLEAGEPFEPAWEKLMEKRNARLKREAAEAARTARAKSAAATKSRRRQVVAAAV